MQNNITQTLPSLSFLENSVPDSYSYIAHRVIANLEKDGETRVVIY